MKRGACLLLLALTSSAAFSQQALPTGWRKPTLVEASGAWRKKSPTKFLVVRGDFDGDGKADTAEILISESAGQFALFAKLAATEKWQMLGEASDIKALDRFGIDLVKPGKYETACGKGYDDSFCAHGEPDFLNLPHAAIDFIYTKSYDIIFYWESNTKTFREIQMSD
jgi:hypothetical protein